MPLNLFLFTFLHVFIRYKVIKDKKIFDFKVVVNMYLSSSTQLLILKKVSHKTYVLYKNVPKQFHYIPKINTKASVLILNGN